MPALLFRQPVHLIALVCALPAASEVSAIEADVVTTEGIRLAADRLERTSDEVLLSTRAGAGWVETRVPLKRIARVLPRGEESAERLVPWLSWVEPEILHGALGEACKPDDLATPATRLSLLRSMRQNWPTGQDGVRRLLEQEGDLAASLGWSDKVRDLVDAWCAAAEEQRPSAWGWWKRAESEWTAGRVEEAAWAAAAGVSSASHPSAPGLAECHAYLFACETRLGQTDRATAVADAARSLGLELPRPSQLLPWLPGANPQPKDADTPSVPETHAQEGRPLESIRRLRPSLLIPAEL
jgi:hypothetical protein